MASHCRRVARETRDLGDLGDPGGRLQYAAPIHRSRAAARDAVEPGRSYFDTNTADHHHFFCEATGKLLDILAEQFSVSGLPLPPAGTEIRRVEIIVRIHPGGVDHL